jgi:hypothetical protein
VISGLPPAQRSELLTIVSTEHFTLQGARGAAISDANGRTGFFLSTLSAVVVALAFVAQLSGGLSPTFGLFAGILLPMLLFIGLATFERLLQLAIENIRCVVAINRLRHYYMEIAPELAPHLTLSPYDDMSGVLASVGSVRTRMRPWDLLISNAGLLGVIDAMLAGILAGLAGWAASTNAWIAAAAAFAIGALVLSLLMRYSRNQLSLARTSVGVRFASARGIDTSHIHGADDAAASPDQDQPSGHS